MSSAYTKAHPLDPTKGSRVKKVPPGETDVNLIVERYRRTGQIPVATRHGAYADVSKTTDFRQAVDDGLKYARQPKSRPQPPPGAPPTNPQQPPAANNSAAGAAPENKTPEPRKEVKKDG